MLEGAMERLCKERSPESGTNDRTTRRRDLPQESIMPSNSNFVDP